MTASGEIRGQAPWAARRKAFLELSPFEMFEQVIVFLLTLVVIAVVIALSVHLFVVLGQSIVSTGLHDKDVFQSVFGIIFTILIALEFKHSLLVVLARQENVVRVRSVILIAMLAMVRKFLILDLGAGEPSELFALSAAILSLGIVFWLVRRQDRALGAEAGLSTRGERP